MFNYNVSVKDCIFSACDYHDIQNKFEYLLDLQILNCNFFNCEIDIPACEDRGIFFTNCTANPNFVSVSASVVKNEEVIYADPYEKHVLAKFWPAGKERFFPYKRIGTLRLGAPPEEYESIEVAVASLIRKGILINGKGRHALELNIKNLNEIKRILGR